MRHSLLLKHEKACVDPLVPDDRFLRKALHTPVCVELQRSILRPQRNRCHRSLSTAFLMKFKESLQINIPQPIAIGCKEPLTYMARARTNAVCCIGLGARIQYGGLPIRKAPLEVIQQHLLAVPCRQHKPPKALPRINVHQVHQNRASVDRHHRLGEILRKGINPGAFAPTQNHYLHVTSSRHALLLTHYC